LKILAHFCQRGKKAGLQRIGSVLHVSSSRSLILKADHLPRIGDKVVDDKLSNVGTVFDMFGPVSSPYVAVKPSVDEPSLLVGHSLYAVPSAKLRRERRRR
jgi:RNA-binding protein